MCTGLGQEGCCSSAHYSTDQLGTTQVISAKIGTDLDPDLYWNIWPHPSILASCALQNLRRWTLGCGVQPRINSKSPGLHHQTLTHFFPFFITNNMKPKIILKCTNNQTFIIIKYPQYSLLNINEWSVKPSCGYFIVFESRHSVHTVLIKEGRQCIKA